LFCGRAADRYLQDELLIFPEIIAGLTLRFIALIVQLFEKAHYIGMLDLGITITGLKGGVVYTNDARLQYTRSHYDLDTYRKSSRFSVLQTLDDPISTSKYLVMPLINAISDGWIHPYQDK
jgi:hypothetical protein